MTFATGSFISPAEAIAGFGWAFLLIAALSAFSTVLLIYAIRTTGAVFASQAGYSMTAGGILWSVLLLNEQMTLWVWAALACLVSGLALVMPKQIDGEADLDQRMAKAQPTAPKAAPGSTAPGE